MLFSSVQRRKILREAGFLPYLGGRDPYNPITPEALPAGSMEQDPNSELAPENGQEEEEEEEIGPKELEDLKKVIEVLKFIKGDCTDEEIRQAAIKILQSYNHTITNGI